MKYVVIYGTLAGGIQTVHGPFHSLVEANEWISLNHPPGTQFVILPIEKP